MPMFVIEINDDRAKSYRVSLYSGQPSHWSGKSLKHDSCLCNTTPLINYLTVRVFKPV